MTELETQLQSSITYCDQCGCPSYMQCDGPFCDRCGVAFSSYGPVKLQPQWSGTSCLTNGASLALVQLQQLAQYRGQTGQQSSLSQMLGLGTVRFGL